MIVQKILNGCHGCIFVEDELELYSYCNLYNHSIDENYTYESYTNKKPEFCKAVSFEVKEKDDVKFFEDICLTCIKSDKCITASTEINFTACTGYRIK